MGLKDAIVIKNDFTNQYHHGHGVTPGTFLIKYISRHGATEPMMPQNGSTLDDFVTRYINRERATERAGLKRESSSKLTAELEDGPLAGRAFGNLGDSYTHQQLMDAAKDVQDLWDQGHTVQKMVVSFDTEYLKQMGLLPSDFLMSERGAAKGQLDQMKLRHALNKGMDAYTKEAGFVNPQWTGSVQVDTLHVHAHIVCVDQCDLKDTNRVINGEERGKIYDNEKQVLRKNLNHELQDMKPLYQLHHQVDLDKANVLSNVDDLINNQHIVDDQLGHIIASLPQNRSLWSINSHAKVMRKPNQLMHQYVDTLCDNYGTLIGYNQAEQAFDKYADQKVAIDGGQKQQYINQGTTQLKNQIGNRIYQSLRENVNQRDLTVDTQFIRQEAQDLDELTHEMQQRHQRHQDESMDDLLYTYRLNSYGERMEHHEEQSKSYYQAMQEYQDLASRGNTNQASIALYDHLRMEERYHLRAMDKYRYFSRDFDVTSKEMQDYYKYETNALTEQRQRVINEGRQMGIVDDSKSMQRFELELTQLLQDPQAEAMLQQPVSKQKTVQKTVIDYLQGYPFDNVGRYEVQRYVQGKPQYQSIEQHLDQWVSNENQRQFQYDVSQYQNQASKLTHQGFKHEQFVANDVIDPFDYQRNPLPHHQSRIKMIPKLRDQDHYLDDTYFNSIKGLDLQDLQFDFGVDQEIKVTPLVRDTYCAEVAGRKQAMLQAQDYLTASKQSTSMLQPVSHELQRAQKIVDELQDGRTIKLGVDKDEVPILESQRNLATVDDQTTSRLVSQHIQAATQERKRTVDKINRDLNM